MIKKIKVYNILNNYKNYEFFKEKEISPSNMLSVATDGAPGVFLAYLKKAVTNEFAVFHPWSTLNC